MSPCPVGRLAAIALAVALVACGDVGSTIAPRTIRPLSASVVPYAPGVRVAAVPDLDDVAGYNWLIGDPRGPKGINDLGEIVGTRYVQFVVGGTGEPSDSENAFVWTPTYGLRILYPEAGDVPPGTSAVGVNDRAQVAVSIPGPPGDSVTSYTGIWYWQGNFRRLRNLSTYFLEGSLLPQSPCTPSGINASGVIVGDCFIAGTSAPVATVWTAYGNPWPLSGHLVAGSANAISDAGYVAAASYFGFGNNAIVFTPTGQERLLANPPNNPPGAQTAYAAALAVNDSGWAAGYRISADTNCSSPVVWLAADTAIVIGPCGYETEAGYGEFRTWSAATGITDAGVVVGTMTDTVGAHAFVWTASTGLERLPGLRGGVAESQETSSAIAISDQGHKVVGWIANSVQGYHHTVVWTLP